MLWQIFSFSLAFKERNQHSLPWIWTSSLGISVLHVGCYHNIILIDSKTVFKMILWSRDFCWLSRVMKAITVSKCQTCITRSTSYFPQDVTVCLLRRGIFPENLQDKIDCWVPSKYHSELLFLPWHAGNAQVQTSLNLPLQLVIILT